MQPPVKPSDCGAELEDAKGEHHGLRQPSSSGRSAGSTAVDNVAMQVCFQSGRFARAADTAFKSRAAHR
jgi:hypothetical protein